MDRAQILAFIASSNHALSLDRFMALRMSRRVLSTCRTAAVRPRGALPWRYAAMPGSAISRYATIPPERSARSSELERTRSGLIASGSSLYDIIP